MSIETQVNPRAKAYKFQVANDLRWFVGVHPVSFTNETDCHCLTEIFLNSALKHLQPITLKMCVFPATDTYLSIYHNCILDSTGDSRNIRIAK